MGLLGGLLLAFYLLGSLDWRGAPPTSPPRLQAIASAGPMRVGIAAQSFTPGTPMPLGGFIRRKGVFTEVLDPLFARALVFSTGSQKLALVSFDLLLVPPALAEAIAADARTAGIDRVIVTATHTHAAPGGYFDNPLARFGGLGAYDPTFTRKLTDAAGEALRAARTALKPARLTVRNGRGPEVCRSRIPGRAPDRRLTVITLASVDDAQIFGRVVVFACHPTVLGHRDLRLSAGWPGALSAQLEGVTLLLQGAAGDVTHGAIASAPEASAEASPLTPAKKMRALGAQVAAAVRALEAGVSGQTVEAFTEIRARVDLPGPSAAGFAPEGLQGLATNLLTFLVPDTATVSLLELGRPGVFRLAFLPGEVVSPLGSRWAREATERSGVATRVVSLADGYLGYLETPEALAAHGGESRRAYFDAATIHRLEEALEAAEQAITAAPPG